MVALRVGFATRTGFTDRALRCTIAFRGLLFEGRDTRESARFRTAAGRRRPRSHRSQIHPSKHRIKSNDRNLAASAPAEARVLRKDSSRGCFAGLEEVCVAVVSRDVMIIESAFLCLHVCREIEHWT